MKMKAAVKTALALVLVGGMLTACTSVSAATITTSVSEVPPATIYNANLAQPLSTAKSMRTTQPEEDTNYNAEIITHVQLPTSLLEDLMAMDDDAQIAFWEDFRQNNPYVYHIEFVNEDGEVTVSLMTARATDIADPVYIFDLDEALALHKASNLTMPTYLPEGFIFERAWFSNFSCPLSNPDTDYTGGQLFVVFGDGEQSLTIEIRYHYEENGFDTWTCDFEEITINGQNAIVGGGGLSVQVTPTARYTFMTWPFADAPGSTICYDDLIKIAKSVQ